MKRLNNKGFGVVEGLLVLVVIGIIGGTGFYVYKTNSKTGNGSDGTSIEKAEKDSSDENKEKIPEGYKKFENKDLGISFIYPSEWGEVVKTEFDDQGNSEYFNFSKFDHVTMGSLQSDYTHPGRGGSLIDYGGYIKEGGKFKLKSYENKPLDEPVDGYILNNPQSCIVSTSVNYFESSAYHAVCNVSSNKIYGFNFAVYETSKVPIDQFQKLVNSVKVK